MLKCQHDFNKPWSEVHQEIFDPNQIRRRIAVSFSQHIFLTELSNVPGRYRLDLNDHLGYQVFISGKINPDLILLGRKIGIGNDDIFLDIGANTGLVCIPFATQFNAEVIAIEASRRNSSELLLNAEINQVKLHLHSVCVTDFQSRLATPWIEIFGRIGNSGATSIHRAWNPSKGEITENWVESVPAATIDELIPMSQLGRIALIKIDVEGSEDLALNGFKNISATDAPIVFEYRIDLMKKFLNANSESLIYLLEQHFKLFSYQVVGDQIVLENFDTSISQENAIGFPKSKLAYYLQMFEN